MKRLICLLALSFFLPAGAEPLGRLFFDPARRAALDAARQQERKAREPQEKETPMTSITLNGVVTRSDGSGTVWINNKPHTGQRGPQGAAEVAVTPPAGGRTVWLKVGQSLDPGSGRIEEGYRRMPPAEKKAPGGQ